MSQLTYHNPALDRDVPGSSRALHILAWITACAVFPLIFMGGLVTSNHAGLAVPDWPNSYGYNMFLFPPSYWVGGIFFEHTHRLLGTVVGFCSILLVLQAYAPARNPAPRFWIATGALLSLLLALCPAITMVATHNTDPLASPAARILSHTAVLFSSLFLILTAAYFPRHREPRPWVRRLTFVILAAVLFQGLLGGLRVVFVNLNLAVIHGCFAQAFFCLCAFFVIVTGRWWQSTPSPTSQAQGLQSLALSPLPPSSILHPPSSSSRTLTRLALTAVVIVYLQLIAGATMRHFNAGLAIPDLPLNYGHLLPPTDPASLPAINEARSAEPTLLPVTLGQIWLHFTHRVGALVVTAALTALILYTLRKFRPTKALTRPATLLIFLLLSQITLGILTVLLRKPAEIATAHVAVGALVLVTTFTLFIRSLRLYGWGKNAIISGPAPVGDHVGHGAVTA